MVAALLVFLSAAHSPVVGLCQFLYSLAAIPRIGVSAYAFFQHHSSRLQNTNASVQLDWLPCGITHQGRSWRCMQTSAHYRACQGLVGLVEW